MSLRKFSIAMVHRPDNQIEASWFSIMPNGDAVFYLRSTKHPTMPMVEINAIAALAAGSWISIKEIKSE